MSYSEMQASRIPLCVSIKAALKQDTGCCWGNASLGESARCGCRYCRATCEAKPEYIDSDCIIYELRRENLTLWYKSFKIAKELFVLEGKSRILDWEFS